MTPLRPCVMLCALAAASGFVATPTQPRIFDFARPTAPMPSGPATAQPRIFEITRPAMAVMSEATDIEEICEVVPDVCNEVEQDAAAVFAIIDVNGDGSITRKELSVHLTKAGYNDKAIGVLFDKLDTDGDDEISLEELQTGFMRYTPLREAPGLGAYNAKFIEEIHADADALFAAIDVDGNGSIEKAELQEHLKRTSKYSFKAIGNIFRMLDVNKDGGIERAELRDAFVRFSALRQAIGEGPNFK